MTPQWVLALLFPATIGVFLCIFTHKLRRSAAVEERAEGDSTVHNERIYEDFECFIKVSLALAAGVGYVKLKENLLEADARSLIVVLAAVGMIAMAALAISVICQQASKIRRWPHPRLNEWLRKEGVSPQQAVEVP